MSKLKRVQKPFSRAVDLKTEVTFPKWIQPKLDGVGVVAVEGEAFYSSNLIKVENKKVQYYFGEHGLHGLQGNLIIGDTEDDIFYVVCDKWNAGDDVYWRRLGQLAIFEEYQIEGLSLVETAIVNSLEEAEEYIAAVKAKDYDSVILRDPESLYKFGIHTLKSQALLKVDI